MKWLLVVLVLNTPVKTDLVFDDLEACLAGEKEMREEWASAYNSALSKKASQETLAQMRSQMIQGTCIPTASLATSDT